jgi:DivIVA domain-containing protein
VSAYGMGPAGAAFPVVKWQLGYDVGEVDAFMATISSRAPSQIRRQTFTVRRFRGGYRMQDVDDALDAWATSLEAGNPDTQE